jgi:DNA mismatch repair ATPase MutS
LAQIGSFVPAQTCRIGVFDAILTRMGVADDFMQGMSTFMLEMSQAARILNQATSKTLCIMDEVGRGTSSYDGFAVAKATLGFLCKDMTCPCFFITHYTALAGMLEETKDEAVLGALNLSFHRPDDSAQVAFLYQVVPGVSQQSYGMNVARLAGIPAHIIEEASKLAAAAARNAG